jgi:TIR domain
MAEVFISYARKDRGFVRDLHVALQKVNRDTWIDWRSIPESAKWRAEIFAAIEAADNFLFIISPDSLRSSMCKQEVAHAVASGKRILTVLYHNINQEELLPGLREIQWISYPELGFEESFRRLTVAIDADLEWARKHTRFGLRAAQWEANGRGQRLTAARLGTARGHSVAGTGARDQRSATYTGSSTIHPDE